MDLVSHENFLTANDKIQFLSTTIERIKLKLNERLIQLEIEISWFYQSNKIQIGKRMQSDKK